MASTTNQNLFSAVPTVTGSSINEVLTMTMTPDATAQPNDPNCVYNYPVTYLLIAQ